jgi:hypothetical protein
LSNASSHCCFAAAAEHTLKVTTPHLQPSWHQAAIPAAPDLLQCHGTAFEIIENKAMLLLGLV